MNGIRTYQNLRNVATRLRDDLNNIPIVLLLPDIAPAVAAPAPHAQPAGIAP